MREFPNQKYWLSTFIGIEYYLRTEKLCGRVGETNYNKQSFLHYGKGNKGRNYIYMNVEGIEPQITVSTDGYFDVLSHEEMKPEEYMLILAKFKQLLEETSTEESKLEVTELKCEV